MPLLLIWCPAEAVGQGARIQLEEDLVSQVVCPAVEVVSLVARLGAEEALVPVWVPVRIPAQHVAHNATLTVRCEGSVAKLAWRVAIRSRRQNGSTDSAAESASQFHLPRAASSYPL